ncbi:tRNA pseudouridine(55) synthase TruB [Actinomyces sp.]|uniref:tRNA pseudouridine(55) synthase TruB n=1 Tax=Actinomyces sp. TaxID=29317 RepID=UPI00289E2E9B|nr:tRNA pseudouridine(55) synthase TruB [Actinomyces sp.]
MATDAGASPSGLLVVDKDQGMTSHDVVARVRRLAHTRKVGHAGTLDPMATGVLVLGINRATRLLTWVTGHSKAYEATMRLGVSTNTDDAEGEVVDDPGCADLDDDRLEQVMAPLRGDIEQVPSSVSAIKIDGRRAYALAREGVDVDIPARAVHIGRLDVVGVPREELIGREGRPLRVTDVDIRVECSSGTYVRALARDIGAALGVGGHLTRLRRTEVGSFTLSDAETLPELTTRVEGGAALPVIDLGVAARAMFPDLPIDEDEAARFAHGQAPRRTGPALEELHAAAGEDPLAVLAPDGVTVLGLARIEDGRVRTVLVF